MGQYGSQSTPAPPSTNNNAAPAPSAGSAHLPAGAGGPTPSSATLGGDPSAYVGGSPTSSTDPSGLAAMSRMPMSVGQDHGGFAEGDSNLYRYVGNRPTNAADPSGLAEGQHWVPISVSWRLYKEGVISRNELLYFAGRRSGALLTPHNWGTTYGNVRHCDYNAEVEKQLRRWKGSKDPSAVTPKEIADRIRDGKTWNGRRNEIIDTFNTGVKGDMKPLAPGKPNLMDGEGNSDEQIRNKGKTSLKKRGKFLILLGAMGGILDAADAYGQGSQAANVLSRGMAMNRAKNAALAGDMSRMRLCLTGTGNPQASVYEELQNVNKGFALGFRGIVDPLLEQMERDLEQLESELRDF